MLIFNQGSPHFCTPSNVPKTLCHQEPSVDSTNNDSNDIAAASNVQHKIVFSIRNAHGVVSTFGGAMTTIILYAPACLRGIVLTNNGTLALWGCFLFSVSPTLRLTLAMVHQ